MYRTAKAAPAPAVQRFYGPSSCNCVRTSDPDAWSFNIALFTGVGVDAKDALNKGHTLTYGLKIPVELHATATSEKAFRAMTCAAALQTSRPKMEEFFGVAETAVIIDALVRTLVGNQLTKTIDADAYWETAHAAA